MAAAEDGSSSLDFYRTQPPLAKLPLCFKEKAIAPANIKPGWEEMHDQSMPQENMPESSARFVESNLPFEPLLYTKESNQMVGTCPEILTNRTGVILAAVFSTTDAFSAHVTRAADKVRKALRLQADYELRENHGTFKI